MDITYRKVGDYKIPNLKLLDEAAVPLGKWGRSRRDYLRYHKSALFTIMISDGTLWKHLLEVDEQAEKMFDRLVREICEEENINEELKEKDQICWVRSMNNVYNRVTELVNHELIYT